MDIEELYFKLKEMLHDISEDDLDELTWEIWEKATIGDFLIVKER